jgi:hypothetical protein
MSTRTEQQNRIETELKQLIELSKTKSLKGHFEINFITLSDARQGDVSESFIYKDIVVLRLIEQKHQHDLEEWIKPIIDCYGLLKRIEEQNIYKRENPDFFKALKSIVEIEKK